MPEILDQMLNVDAYTMSIVVALTGWSVFVITVGIGSGLFAAIFAIPMGFGALAALHVAREHGISLLAYRDADIIAIASIGIVLGFLLTSSLYRITQDIFDMRRRAVTNTNPTGEQRVL